MNTESTIPAPWLRDLDSAFAVNSHVLLTGNIRDRYLLDRPDGGEGGQTPTVAMDLASAVWSVLHSAGYECLIVVDPTRGVRCQPANDLQAQRAAEEIIGQVTDGPVASTEIESMVAAVSFGRPRQTTDDASSTVANRRVALLIENAAHLVRDPGSLERDEHRFFSAIDSLASRSPNQRLEGDTVGLYNVCLWALRSERDVPPFFAAQNASVRQVPVPLPDLTDRHAFIRLFTSGIALEGGVTTADVDAFARTSDGLTLSAITEVLRLALREGIPGDELPEAARRYRLGVPDNPWRRPALRDALEHGEATLRRRVFGQDGPIRRALDVIKRSNLGLTAAHAAGRGSRPRGVLFFAGPTGVGKTELAKALAELIFGVETAYVRFDMSEFSAEHAEARLIGAPPGFVGYGTGGELTNAVRRRPFSLVLFDEIEKAHPRILDKFLQVLEDGRLTDGAGATVYFSETVLVFTSNVGMTRPSAADPTRREPNVDSQMAPEAMEEHVRTELSRFFREDLNRPELLNRLGDNIVVFRFIDATVGEQIFDLGIRRVAARLKDEHDADLVVEPAARAALLEYALSDGLAMGGRGVGARLEGAFVNPLSRELFSKQPLEGATVTVTGAFSQDGEWNLTLQ